MNQSSALFLFDIDGTLIRRAGPHHKTALIEGIQRATGIATTLDGVATQGMLDGDLIASMMRTAGLSEWKIRRALRSVMKECQSAYLANCAVDLSPFLCPGIPKLLGQLKERGAVLGLVSGNLSQIGWKKMELAGIRDYFSLAAFAEEGRTRIRLAKVATRRAVKLGLVTKSARVSLMGDHPNDVEAAKANGFQAIAVATGLSNRDELAAAQPDILIDDASELNIEAIFHGLPGHVA